MALCHSHILHTHSRYIKYKYVRSPPCLDVVWRCVCTNFKLKTATSLRMVRALHAEVIIPQWQTEKSLNSICPGKYTYEVMLLDVYTYSRTRYTCSACGVFSRQKMYIWYTIAYTTYTNSDWSVWTIFFTQCTCVVTLKTHHTVGSIKYNTSSRLFIVFVRTYYTHRMNAGLSALQIKKNTSVRKTKPFVLQ